MKEPLIPKRDIIQHLKEHHPYPEDVFKPLNQLQWDQVYEAIELAGIDGERVTGNIARIGYEAAIAKLEDYA